MSIGAFAKAAEVSVETIRFYQHKGMLSTPDWLYGRIQGGAATGIQSDLLALAGGSHCQAARAQAALKLADVRKRLTDMRRIEAALQELLERCNASGSTVCCLLLATLQAG